MDWIYPIEQFTIQITCNFCNLQIKKNKQLGHSQIGYGFTSPTNSPRSEMSQIFSE